MPEETQNAQEYFKYIDKTDPQFNSYFDNYSKSKNLITQTYAHNLIALNRTSTFLFENPKHQTNHIIWITREDETYHHTPVNQEDWTHLRENPDMLVKINQNLDECLINANNFYPWQHRSQGLVIEDSNTFGMESGNFMGIRVSFQEVEHMIKALQSKDPNKIKKEKDHLTASMIHELTHTERDDALSSQVENEIASHIAQFIFDPNGNELFNAQLRGSIEKVTNNEDKSDIYDQAQYNALLIISKKLVEANPEYKKFVEDQNIYQTLSSVWDYCNENEVNHLKDVVLPQIMKTSGQDLFLEAKQIEEKYKNKTN